MSIIRKLCPGKGEVTLQSTKEGPEAVEWFSSGTTLGLRVVNPGQVEAVIDIVFIHGLTGDRESTWTAKGAMAPWPESLLSNNLPQARIVMYGYDADVINFWSMASQNTIGDHSQKFLSSLANMRDSTNSNTRPLVFVAHSLGGIVCQDAFFKSKGSPDLHTQRILENTKGILFMGTPHCGSDLAKWPVVGGNFLQYFRHVNKETLEILKQKSEVMARIRRDFHTMLRGWDQRRDQEMRIICFYEELPVKAVGKIVPDGSATLDRYVSIGTHANHMDMTKFTNDRDPDYVNVLRELERFIQPGNHQSKELPSTYSGPSENQEKSNDETRNNSSSIQKHDLLQPTKLVNTFSDTFNTNGGKMIQGGEFNSGGGAMSF